MTQIYREHWDGIEVECLLGETFRDVIRVDTPEDIEKVPYEESGLYHAELPAILFVTQEGRAFIMLHEQDCCEDVYIESIVGNLQDLVGSPILHAEEKRQSTDSGAYDSETWTFYTLATQKGWVDIRWFGTSNGYYAEDARLYRVVEMTETEDVFKVGPAMLVRKED